MTSALLSRLPAALRIALFSAIAAIGLAGCTAVHYVYPKNMQGFSHPSGCPNTGPADTTQLNACLEGIEFDTTEAIGDEQRLLVRDSGGAPCFGDSTHTCRHGPRAKVEPVVGAELYSEKALQQGRIIARIYLRAGETESYPKFGVVPVDTTYWWVNTAQDTSLFVHRDSTQSDLTVVPRGLTRTSHPRGTFQQGFATWVWVEADETLNGGCGSKCCKP